MKLYQVGTFLICKTICLIHQVKEREGIHQKISLKEQYILHLMVGHRLRISGPEEGHGLPQQMEEECLQTISNCSLWDSLRGNCMFPRATTRTQAIERQEGLSLLVLAALIKVAVKEIV